MVRVTNESGWLARFGRRGGAAIGVAVLISATALAFLPPGVRVPIHVGAEGVDRWTSGLEVVVAILATMLFVWVVGLAVIARQGRVARQRCATRRRSLGTRIAAGPDDGGQGAAAIVMIAVLWLLAALQAALLVASALGDHA